MSHVTLDDVTDSEAELVDAMTQGGDPIWRRCAARRRVCSRTLIRRNKTSRIVLTGRIDTGPPCSVGCRRARPGATDRPRALQTTTTDARIRY